jgi:CBS domain-containing protein
MIIRDVMTHHVIVLRPRDSLREAVAVFAQNGISGAPVVDGRGRVVGIITEMDILRRLEIGSMELCPPATPAAWSSAHGQKRPGLRFKTLSESLEGAGRLPVSRLMTSPVVSARPGDPVQEKAALMVHRRIRRLPVVDGNGVLVGILSRKDLIRMLHGAGPAGKTRPAAPGLKRRPKQKGAGGKNHG